jgi:hypothetical protein
VLASLTELITILESLGAGPKNLGFGTSVTMPWSRSMLCGMNGPLTATLFFGCHQSAFCSPLASRACEILTGGISAVAIF